MEDIERVLLSLISIKDTKITYKSTFRETKKDRSKSERFCCN
nr:MAG TPA: hypothetical protein [Caudoviricetes sp.]DAY27462.1 MAG TPA: hypothetical protein [Caudoviricetes sp.]